MPLAPSLRDRKEQLRIDTAKKMVLERNFILRLKPYFRRLAKDAAIEYRRSQSVLILTEAEEELNVMLKGQYRRVQDKFKKSIQEDTFKRHDIELLQFKQDLNTDINVDLAEYRILRSNQESRLITETTQKDLNESFLNTIIAFNENNIRPTPNQVALAASVEFNRRSQARTTTISQTETQNSAESTKSIEAAAILAAGIVIAGQVINETVVIKTWSTLLDGSTRLSHAEADDQQVPEFELFRVQGQLLEFPGDASHGASLNNIINCRCNSSRIIDLVGNRPGAIPLAELEGARQPRGNVPFTGQLQAD